ncbi:MAG: hypothetical protein AB1638_07450 [Nitrospirota bacterium]
MRKSNWFFITIFLLMIAASTLYIHSMIASKNFSTHLDGKKKIVSMLELTDFVLSTDARYTRHPSQADIFTPFQDCPASIEHFPSGSVIAFPLFEGIDSRFEVRHR